MKQQMVLENKKTSTIWNTPMVEKPTHANHSENIRSDKITIKSLNLKQTSVTRMHKLWDTLNTRLFGIYLTFSGEVNGQCIVIAESEIAYTVIDTITNNPSGTTKSLENVEEAIIGEMGNSLGPILLNAIVTKFRINSQPNPSIVLYDTAAALYDIASTEMGAEDPHMYILETTLAKGNNEMNGTFFIMLNPDIVSSKSGKTSLLRSTT